jgi:hypothetical protein
MRPGLFTAALLLLLPAAGCIDEELQGLDGRWEGTISCFEGDSDVTMGFEIEGAGLGGTAQIRAKENNTSWKVQGIVAHSCDQDTCTKSRDCPDEHGEPRKCGVDDKGKVHYNPVCIEKMKQRNPKCVAPNDSCDPCVDCAYCLKCIDCKGRWLPIQVTLQDKHAIMQDPLFKLWRYSERTLRGTVERYCNDEKSLRPEVYLYKN